MTTFATDHETQLREFDERTRTAWADYRGSLDDLDGEAYEEAELVSWERLQSALHELAGERERVVETSRPEPDVAP